MGTLFRRGTVSAKTLLKLLPFVEDPDYEIEEVERHKAEEVKRQQELFSAGANMPPDFGGEDDEEEMDGQEDGDGEGNEENRKEKKADAGRE